jgi:hypothetical protein
MLVGLAHKFVTKSNSSFNLKFSLNLQHNFYYSIFLNFIDFLFYYCYPLIKFYCRVNLVFKNQKYGVNLMLFKVLPLWGFIFFKRNFRWDFGFYLPLRTKDWVEEAISMTQKQEFSYLN